VADASNRVSIYWRGRIRKAERLVLETLTQAYPDGLTMAKTGDEANVALSITPWAD
jgi:hypothetical protein